MLPYWWKCYWRLSNLDILFSKRDVCTWTGPTPKCFHFCPLNCETSPNLFQRLANSPCPKSSTSHIYLPLLVHVAVSGALGSASRGTSAVPMPMGEPGWAAGLPHFTGQGELTVLEVPTSWWFSWTPCEPWNRQTAFCQLCAWEMTQQVYSRSSVGQIMCVRSWYWLGKKGQDGAVDQAHQWCERQFNQLLLFGQQTVCFPHGSSEK